MYKIRTYIVLIISVALTFNSAKQVWLSSHAILIGKNTLRPIATSNSPNRIISEVNPLLVSDENYQDTSGKLWDRIDNKPGFSADLHKHFYDPSNFARALLEPKLYVEEHKSDGAYLADLSGFLSRLLIDADLLGEIPVTPYHISRGRVEKLLELSALNANSLNAVLSSKLLYKQVREDNLLDIAKRYGVDPLFIHYLDIRYSGYTIIGRDAGRKHAQDGKYITARGFFDDSAYFFTKQVFLGESPYIYSEEAGKLYYYGSEVPYKFESFTDHGKGFVRTEGTSSKHWYFKVNVGQEGVDRKGIDFSHLTINFRNFCLNKCPFCWRTYKEKIKWLGREVMRRENLSVDQGLREIEDAYGAEVFKKIKRISVVEGCFGGESQELAYLEELIEKLRERGFKGEIAVISAFTGSMGAFKRLRLAGYNMQEYFFPLECFTARKRALGGTKRISFEGALKKMVFAKKCYGRVRAFLLIGLSDNLEDLKKYIPILAENGIEIQLGMYSVAIPRQEALLCKDIKKDEQANGHITFLLDAALFALRHDVVCPEVQINNGLWNTSLNKYIHEDGLLSKAAIGSYTGIESLPKELEKILSAVDRFRDKPDIMIRGITVKEIARRLGIKIKDIPGLEEKLTLLVEKGHLNYYVRTIDISAKADKAKILNEKGYVLSYSATQARDFSKQKAKDIILDEARAREYAAALIFLFGDRFNPTLIAAIQSLGNILDVYEDKEIELLKKKIQGLTYAIRRGDLFNMISDANDEGRLDHLAISMIYEFIIRTSGKMDEIARLVDELKAHRINVSKSIKKGMEALAEKLNAKDSIGKYYKTLKIARDHFAYVRSAYAQLAQSITILVDSEAMYSGGDTTPDSPSKTSSGGADNRHGSKLGLKDLDKNNVFKVGITAAEFNKRFRSLNKVSSNFHDIGPALAYIKNLTAEATPSRPVIVLLDGMPNTGKTALLSSIMRGETCLDAGNLIPVRDTHFHSIFSKISNNDYEHVQTYGMRHLKHLLSDAYLISTYRPAYQQYLAYYLDKYLRSLVRLEGKNIILWDEVASESYFTSAFAHKQILDMPVRVVCLMLEKAPGTEKCTANVSYWEWGTMENISAAVDRAKKEFSCLSVELYGLDHELHRVFGILRKNGIIVAGITAERIEAALREEYAGDSRGIRELVNSESTIPYSITEVQGAPEISSNGLVDGIRERMRGSSVSLSSTPGSINPSATPITSISPALVAIDSAA